MQCPKCGYERSEQDQAPDWQCPSCGVVYHKVAHANTSANAKPARVNAASRTTARLNFKKVRIVILLILLMGVALDSWLAAQRSTSWENPLWVVVYPINADGSAAVADYLPSLQNGVFAPIEEYFIQQAGRYGWTLKDPVALRLGPTISETPPLPPANGHPLEVMWWSLKLRYWSLVVDSYDGPRPDIRVFVLYNMYAENKRLAHSTGLRKGMISVVHAFADERAAARNNVVIAHEMLHTLGATDKYDLASGEPLFPDGYAEPDQIPLLPQRYGEIMGAYIPQSEREWLMPESLSLTLIGPMTATEIGWLGNE